MDFFGIGFLEIFFIVLIALIVLGPQDMVKAGRMMGSFLRKLMLAPGFMEAQRWVRNLPAQLMREAGIDEIQEDLRREAARIKEETTVNLDPGQEVPNTIAKPASANPSPTYPPPLTPFQNNGSSQETGAAQSEHTGTAAASPIKTYPAARAVPKPEDLPSEWVSDSGAQAAQAKWVSSDDFPIEWIKPPEQNKSQEPGAGPSLASVPDEEDAEQD